MVESVNRYGVLPADSAPAPPRPAMTPDPEPEADPVIVPHSHVDSDSEDPINPAAKASSPIPIGSFMMTCREISVPGLQRSEEQAIFTYTSSWIPIN